jgi:hypothetical protein
MIPPQLRMPLQPLLSVYEWGRRLAAGAEAEAGSGAEAWLTRREGRCQRRRNHLTDPLCLFRLVYKPKIISLLFFNFFNKSLIYKIM